MIEAFIRCKADAHIRCEYLVVGSGAGGSLTASCLLEKGKDVLIVEEGPYVRPDVEHSSINSSFPELWRNGGISPVLSQCNFAIAEGSCIGGGTMVNSALIHRIPLGIINEWKDEFKISDFDDGLMKRYHDTIEKELSVQVIENSNNRVNILFKDGARKCGFKGMDVPMAAEIRDGKLRKMDMQKTFLKKSVKKGVKIISDCRVNKILVNSRRASLVEAIFNDIDGSKKKITISFKGIFICAGAIQTPLLLRRSGITKNVGENIHFHPTFRAVAEFDEPLDAYAIEMPSFQIKEFAPDISIGASVMTPAYTAAGLSVNWETNRTAMKNFNNLATFYVMTRCSSKGKVRNLLFLKDSCLVKYRLNEQEVRNLSFGFAKLAEVLFAAGARRLYPAIDGHKPISDQKGSDHYSRNNIPSERMNLMTIHSFSSCPMGEDKKKCAVDSFGKLHGYKNIYINDASILPNSPGVNPQGPLMAVALRNMEKFFG